MSQRASGRHQHTDPNSDSVRRRSCTPDGAATSAEELSGSASNATHHQHNRPSTNSAVGTPHKTPSGVSGDHQASPPQQQQPSSSGRQLMARYKILINDVVAAAGQPTNLPLIDDFIALTEDALRGLRTAKMDSRNTLRRLQSNPLPLSRKDEDVKAGDEGGQTTPNPKSRKTQQPAVHAVAPPSSTSADATLPPPQAPALLVDDVQTAAPLAATGASDFKPRSYAAAVKRQNSVSPVKLRPSSSSAVPPSATTATAASTPTASSKAQELEKRAAELTADKIVAERDSSALRSADKQRQAEERRREYQVEKLAKLEEDRERSERAKQRRDAAIEKVRTETKERLEAAGKRAEDSKATVREKAQRSSSRVDEVRFISDTQQKNLALKLELRMSEAEQNLEQRREEAARAMKEKQEAHSVVVERHRDMSQQRVEKHQQREAQRLENLKRLEESKRMESEQKQQKAEEREKKVQAQLQVAIAEAEARKARTEERIVQSQQLRDEQREKQKLRLERKDQKLKEAKERREEGGAAAGGAGGAGGAVSGNSGSGGGPTSAGGKQLTYQDVLPSMHSAEDEQVTMQRLQRALTTAQRQGRTFVELFQKESQVATKDVNRSRLRPPFHRIASYAPTSPPATVVAPSQQTPAPSQSGTGATGGAAAATTATIPVAMQQYRQPLHDILSMCASLTDADHLFVRFSNGFEPLVRLLLDSRRTHDLATFRLCSDVLHRLLSDPIEGQSHCRFFVRAGHLHSIFVLIYDEVRTLRKHNKSVPLTCCLSLASMCVSSFHVITPAAGGGSGAAASSSNATSGTAAATAAASAASTEILGGVQRLSAAKEQLMTDLCAVGLDKFCFAIAATCVDDDDMPCLQYALLILYGQLLWLSKRKPSSSSDAASTNSVPSSLSSSSSWISQAVVALFTLLQNILTPGGQALKAQAVLPSNTTCVIFTALRVLATIARWKLDSLQELIHGGAGFTSSSSSQQQQQNAAATAAAAAAASAEPAALCMSRMELFHIFSSFFQYVASHDETLERIPPASLQDLLIAAGGAASTSGGGVDVAAAQRSFTECLQFGASLPNMPRVPLPVSCSVDTSASAASTAVASSTRSAASSVGGVLPYLHAPAHYLRAALHELLLLAGYMALCDPAVQEIFSWGKERPLLSLVLQSLPVAYFSQARHLLFPTLLSVVYRDDRNKIILSREVDVSSLHAFLQAEYDGLPPKGKLQSQQYAADAQPKPDQQQPSGGSATAPAASVTPLPRPTLPKKSWADMDDDDDDEVELRIPSPGHPGTAQNKASVNNDKPNAPVEKAKSHVEKEKLAKSLKTIPTGLSHFRLDRRFPSNLWLDALQFLAKELPPPAPQLFVE